MHSYSSTEEELAFCPNATDVKQTAAVNKTNFFIFYVFYSCYSYDFSWLIGQFINVEESTFELEWYLAYKIDSQFSNVIYPIYDSKFTKKNAVYKPI